ncbi:uncharacterized protein LOC114334701 [Diabrotica virgifera virgifera]|uniref:Uncharacterized protein LOC114334701 n=1 Tax=Diabrotica virgifera virgifera TaxID=50390 RepID=A0A6P7G6V3_DIAVI|nr:uncharacterized protein LOC114334701 [Diabrotica virgifera virgifera]
MVDVSVSADPIVLSTDDPERRDCELCGIKYIHINDVEKHINSRKHKLNQRKLTEPEAQNRYNCKDCNKTLTSEEFLRRHVESKSHKKEVEKHLPKIEEYKEKTQSIWMQKWQLRSMSIIDSTMSPSKLDEATVTINEAEEETFDRKKYKVRSDNLAFDRLEPYVYSLVSYLSIRLALDPNTTDFNISVNNRNWPTFGDIIVEQTFSDKFVTYAIRCKNISETPQTIDNLKDAKIFLEKEYTYVTQHKNYSSTTFLIFTTCNTSSKFPEQIEIKPELIKHFIKPSEETPPPIKVKIFPMTKKNYILNVSTDNDNVFLMSPEHSSGLPPIYLYTNQRSYPHSINDLIKKLFPNLKPEFARQYKNYIENWAEGKLGGNYMLSKKDVILKIGELLLSPYTILPKLVNFKSGNFDIWNKVINNTDVVIIKNEPFILSKLCEPFNQLIENSLSTVEEKFKIDPLTKIVTMSDTAFNKISDHQIKAYLLEEGFCRDFHLTILYKVFWKAGKISLLISLEDNEDCKDYILDVISYMKQEGVRKKFMLKTETPFEFTSIPKNLKVFSCLNDVKELVNLDLLKIWVDRKYSLSAKDICKTDPFFLKWVTPSAFFDMIMERITMIKEEGTKMDVQTDFKIILDDTDRNKIKSSLYGAESIPESWDRLAGIDPVLF